MALELDPNYVFRDFVTHGLPSSGKWDPRKPEIRRLLTEWWQTIIALVANSGDLSLPNLLINMSVTGGDENNIVAEANLPVPSGPGFALFSILTEETNTGPVTINGKPLLSSSGSQIPAGGLVAGGLYLFLDGGDTYRLLSDYASSAILLAAEEAAARANEAKVGAETAQNAAEVARGVSEGFSEAAKQARDDAIASAEASGDVLFFDSHSEVIAALPNLGEDQIVEVLVDEEWGDLRTRYRVEGGDLVYKITLNQPSFKGFGKPVSPLAIPTFDGDPNVTHPDVVYVPEGWNGYAYWMVCTPYPDDFREFPALLVSQDGTNWKPAPGAPNPLFGQLDYEAALGPTFYWHTDPDMVLLPDGRMAIYSRPVGLSGGQNSEWLIRTTSINGRDWSPIEILHQTEPGDPIVWRSPAVVVEPDGSFKMWTTGEWAVPPAFAGDRNIIYRTSNDGLVWSEPVLCTVPGNFRAWHIDVVRTYDGIYHMLVNASATSQLMYYWTSTDGVNWSAPLGAGDAQAIPVMDGIDKYARYRSTLQPVSGDPYRFHIWLTVVDNSPTRHRIAAFLPNFQLAGQKNFNLVDDHYLHKSSRFAGLQGSGLRSVFLGITAGSGATGTDQVAIGYDAGLSNAKLYQVAVGSRAGRLQSGDWQTAVGRQAGETNSGNNQTALGHQAGLTNSAGEQVAIGYQAGMNNTGQRQTAIGSRAGVGNTANNTTSIGNLSLAAHTNSIALGYGSQSTQDNQVAVGDRDIEVQAASRGIILRSPNGTRYKVTVNDAGTLVATAQSS